ncbi:MAG: DUF4185 domain-containing protein [Planctomycetota bacterium]|nr:MAG: DUF4185 domain-containing protein [Planctomycetota bacterium]
MLTAAALLLAAPQAAWHAEPAPDWTAVFDRDHGWTGADGIYSIPLDGDERIGADGRTFWVFSDTFIGDVDAQGNRLPGTVLVNNTVAFLPGRAGPAPDQIVFAWGGTPTAPAAMFVPDTPHAAADDFYWLKDGIAIGDRLHLFAGRFNKNPPPFSRRGVSLITIPLDDRPPFPRASQRETPFWRDETPGRGQLALGGAILDNSPEAGAPQPDGFVYVYGVQEDPLNKKAIVARVPRADFARFDRWRFWDGGGWSPNFDDSRPVASRISTEMSVTPLPDGRFLMVFMLDTISRHVAVRTAPAPEGPWSDFTIVYTAPVRPDPPGLFTYHAKAHPHLSEPGELLISYNVNTTGSFWDHFRYADIYRPRFIRLVLD